MDSFELNKIAGAVLSALLVMTVLGFVGQALVSPHRPEKNAYVVEGVERPAAQAQTAAAPPAVEPVAPLLKQANVEAGQAAFRACTSCHTIDKGGPNRVGPNLWGIVGGAKAHAQGFNYSQAMQEKAKQAGDEGRWTYENLNHFLANPKAYIPGTRMAYAGMRNVQDRANLIAWLRRQNDNPPPLP